MHKWLTLNKRTDSLNALPFKELDDIVFVSILIFISSSFDLFTFFLSSLVFPGTREVRITYTFFYTQSIFDPCPENCLSFSQKFSPKIV